MFSVPLLYVLTSSRGGDEGHARVPQFSQDLRSGHNQTQCVAVQGLAKHWCEETQHDLCHSCTAGYVTYVKDQGICGSCWSFGAAEALEGQYYAKYNESTPLSQQVGCIIAGLGH